MFKVVAVVFLPVPDDQELWGEDFMNELDRRIQALTPEDMLDTSAGDARTEKNFKQAGRLHRAEEQP